MKLKEFAENINKLLSERPETADFDVVTARDDEGNGYNLVHYTPTVGRVFFGKSDTKEIVEAERIGRTSYGTTYFYVGDECVDIINMTAPDSIRRLPDEERN